MILGIEDWSYILKNSLHLLNTESLNNFNSYGYEKPWYKYNNGYYSLLFNQMCVIWKYDNKYWFGHYNIEQTNYRIEVFDTKQQLLDRYLYLKSQK